MPCFVVREPGAQRLAKSASGGRADEVGLPGRLSSDRGCRTAGPPAAGAPSNRVTIDASETCDGRCSMVLAHGVNCTIGPCSAHWLKMCYFWSITARRLERWVSAPAALTTAE